MASTPVWKLGVGVGTSCAVLQDDTGWCWGNILLNNNIPMPTQVYIDPVPILSSNDAVFSSIAAGERAACGIFGNETLNCWGSPTAQSIDSAGQSDWTYVSLGNNHACGIVGFGQGLCWGICAGNECGPLESSTLLSAGNRLFRIPNPDPTTPWVQIETSNRILDDDRFNAHTCGIKSDGTAWCWGDNAFGQLGIGNRQSTPTPTKVSGPNLWRDVCTGRGFTCGIDTDGLLLCWGLKIPSQSIDENGSLLEIYGTVPIVLDPDRVTRDIWYTVSCGYFHACVIKATDGTMHCWGENNVGQLGDGTTEPAEIPKLVRTPTTVIWEQSGAGESHTCGMPIDMNQVYCWGSTKNGQLGVGDTDEVIVPVPRLLRFSLSRLPPPSPPVPIAEPSPSVPVQAIPPPPPPPILTPAPAPAPAPEESSGGGTSIGVIAGAAVGGACVLCILGLLLFFFIRKRKNKKGDDKQVSEDIERGSTRSSTGSEDGSPEHPVDEQHPEELPVNDDDDEPAPASVNVFAIPKDASSTDEDEIVPDAPLPTQPVEQQEKEEDHHDDGLYDQGDDDALPTPPTDTFTEEDQDTSQQEESRDDDEDIMEETQEETSFGTSLAAFDTTVLEEKLSLERNPTFVQMYHMTQHFDKGQEYRSKSEKYVSWYKPVETLKDDSKRSTSAKKSKQKFLCEYEGKMNGLKKTADVLQNWSATSSRHFGESCKKIIHIIQDITPTVWELGIMSSPFHAKRIKYGLRWDESMYLDVYKAAQDVAYVMCKRALEITDADKESSSNKSFYILLDATEALFRIYNMCGGLDEHVSSVCPAFMDRVNQYLLQKDPIWYRSRQN
ncbi:hypothetical protein M9435_004626 [Picochlorum sp. BPE23]|nr:hypothetical protein M9435_004626 [Picochlorum sp. BPE23]